MHESWKVEPQAIKALLLSKMRNGKMDRFQTKKMIGDPPFIHSSLWRSVTAGPIDSWDRSYVNGHSLSAIPKRTSPSPAHAGENEPVNVWSDGHLALSGALQQWMSGTKEFRTAAKE